jgi:hypothetical protein
MHSETPSRDRQAIGVRLRAVMIKSTHRALGEIPRGLDGQGARPSGAGRRRGSKDHARHRVINGSLKLQCKSCGWGLPRRGAHLRRRVGGGSPLPCSEDATLRWLQPWPDDPGVWAIARSRRSWDKSPFRRRFLQDLISGDGGRCNSFFWAWQPL